MLSCSNFSETIHVELPDKRQKIIMLEMFRKNLIGQPCNILDDKGIAIRSPLNDIFVLRILDKMRDTSTILYVLDKKIGILLRI